MHAVIAIDEERLALVASSSEDPTGRDFLFQVDNVRVLRRGERPHHLLLLRLEPELLHYVLILELKHDIVIHLEMHSHVVHLPLLNHEFARRSHLPC